MKEPWKTNITNVEPNKISVRGYPIDKLMGTVSFSQALYLVLKGDLPSENVGKLLDVILVSSVDHGVTPPSTLAALNVASTGAGFTSALSAGILAISNFHGGAIEAAMEIFYAINSTATDADLSVQEVVHKQISKMREDKKAVSGFGHRYHTKDPRTEKLFSLAKEYGVSANYVAIANEIADKLHELTGKHLPINVDGAIAALLCELDFPAYAGNLFFILSRVTGLSAHIFEEKTRYKPMRKIEPFNWEYDGENERDVH